MRNEETIIDVNVTLGRWPMRRVPLDETSKLCAKLRANGVVEAWAGSYDGLFHDNLAAVNDRLAEECQAQKAIRLVPFGEMNPLAANWEAELERCAARHNMPGIRLHPNYHGYKLDHPEFARLLKRAADRKLIVQLAVLMEDERMMHPLLRAANINLAPLPELIAQTPGLQLILLNALKGRLDDVLSRLLNLGDVYAEIAMLEGVGALSQLIAEVPPNRILFGSHAPSLYFESALLKLQESDLPAPHRRSITHESARRLVPRK